MLHYVASQTLLSDLQFRAPFRVIGSYKGILRSWGSNMVVLGVSQNLLSQFRRVSDAM